MRFNSKATIQTYSETPNNYGEPVKTWSDGSSIYGWLVHAGGAEKAQRYGIERESQLTFRIYYLASLTTRDRLKIDGKIYQIDDIARDANAVMFANLKLRLTDE